MPWNSPPPPPLPGPLPAHGDPLLPSSPGWDPWVKKQDAAAKQAWCKEDDVWSCMEPILRYEYVGTEFRYVDGADPSAWKPEGKKWTADPPSKLDFALFSRIYSAVTRVSYFKYRITLTFKCISLVNNEVYILSNSWIFYQEMARSPNVPITIYRWKLTSYGTPTGKVDAPDGSQEYNDAWFGGRIVDGIDQDHKTEQPSQDEIDRWERFFKPRPAGAGKGYYEGLYKYYEGLYKLKRRQETPKPPQYYYSRLFSPDEEGDAVAVAAQCALDLAEMNHDLLLTLMNGWQRVTGLEALQLMQTIDNPSPAARRSRSRG